MRIIASATTAVGCYFHIKKQMSLHSIYTLFSVFLGSLVATANNEFITKFLTALFSKAEKVLPAKELPCSNILFILFFWSLEHFMYPIILAEFIQIADMITGKYSKFNFKRPIIKKKIQTSGVIYRVDQNICESRFEISDPELMPRDSKTHSLLPSSFLKTKK